MGTDDLFHKRKAREAESLRRQAAKRAPYDVVLIVCEGEKTEPYYFKGLREHLRLSNANIVIAGNANLIPSALYGDFGGLSPYWPAVYFSPYHLIKSTQSQAVIKIMLTGKYHPVTLTSEKQFPGSKKGGSNHVEEL